MSPPAPPRAMLRVLSDERLARLAGAGHESAFAVLHARHGDALAAYCRSIVRDPDDASDALQNTLLSAWRGIGRRGDAPLRAWLFHIARNESISVLRRRRPMAELRDELPGHGDVHDSAAHRAELEQVLGGLEDLTARQRQALVLRTLGDVGYDEIARIQETSPDAVRQSVSVARRTLRGRRLAGLLPAPGWAGELLRTAAIGGGDAHVALGKAAMTVTATIAAAGAVGGALPAKEARRAAAHTAARTTTAPAAVRDAAAPRVTAVPAVVTSRTRPVAAADRPATSRRSAPSSAGDQRAASRPRRSGDETLPPEAPPTGDRPHTDRHGRAGDEAAVADDHSERLHAARRIPQTPRDDVPPGEPAAGIDLPAAGVARPAGPAATAPGSPDLTTSPAEPGAQTGV